MYANCEHVKGRAEAAQLTWAPQAPPCTFQCEFFFDPDWAWWISAFTCELATKGILDRVSVSPSEQKVCFEYQKGFKYKDTGRTLYVADFDVEKRTVTNAKPFANEEANPSPWYAYPRWTKDETAIVYHANRTGKGELFLYTMKDGSTAKVSTNDNADYRYPHGEATPN